MAITREIALRELAERRLQEAENLADVVAADTGGLLDIHRQAFAAERADTFQIPEDIMTNHYDDPGIGYQGSDEAPIVHSGRINTSIDTSPLSHQGLPVSGYKKEQPAWAVGLVNQHKVLEEALHRQLDHLKVKYSADVDQRQVALARTKLEEAFYHMNRAVFQPERILKGPVSDQANLILRSAGSRAAMTVEELSS